MNFDEFILGDELLLVGNLGKQHVEPECAGADPPGWCASPWCYVDPCFCDQPGVTASAWFETKFGLTLSKAGLLSN